MKPSRALAHVRQLCCLGLARETLIAELLTAVQAVIPSTANIFVGLGQDGLPCDVIPEFVIPEALAAFTADLPRVFPPLMLTKNLAIFQSQRIMDDPAGLWENFYHSDLYNLVWRPYDQYHCLQAVVRDERRPGGLLHLFRGRYSTAFSSEDKVLLERLLIYIEHGLQAAVPAMTDYADSGRNEMLILDAQGALLHASAAARELLALACFPTYRIGTGNALPLPPELEQICRNLQGIFLGRNAPPPVVQHVNPRGRFILRAHWLDPLRPAAGKLIGVTIQHQEPAVLQTWRAIRQLRLSPVQMEVCLLLAQDHSQEAIGQRLNIKPTTVKDHVRKLYDKLGVGRRDELTARLAVARALC
ncbi:helix-turn-helix transcriptional regulator [uncultured Thiodictyon sp.]|uniref:helix-turn-helix transcriptional regulator n=1 Tax=uncultured Thiodictyon sp. TaxID=1846217 RepID=UPI0025F930CC|nr:helix-turn-helix transcriptional regulator [uncultured Thiodictyon sp.]